VEILKEQETINCRTGNWMPLGK